MIGKRELVALLNLSSWCLVMVEWLFLAVPWDCLRFVIVVFPDHTHLLFSFPSFISCLFIFISSLKPYHGGNTNFAIFAGDRDGTA